MSGLLIYSPFLLLFPFLAICVSTLDHELIALQVLFSSELEMRQATSVCTVALELSVKSYPHTWITVNT